MQTLELPAPEQRTQERVDAIKVHEIEVPVNEQDRSRSASHAPTSDDGGGGGVAGGVANGFAITSPSCFRGLRFRRASGIESVKDVEWMFKFVGLVVSTHELRFLFKLRVPASMVRP